MSNGAASKADAEYNNGLERGRRHQERGGYPPPTRVMYLPEAEQRAYMAGWDLGHARTTPLSLLRR
jgi:hypothetical protein